MRAMSIKHNPHFHSYMIILLPDWTYYGDSAARCHFILFTK